MGVIISAGEEYEVGTKHVQLCDETFEIVAIIEENETKKRWFVLKLSERDHTINVRCHPEAIVTALIDYGVPIHKKEMTKYLTKELFNIQRQLEVIRVNKNEIDLTYYELLIHFVWENETEFQKESNLLKIDYLPENKAVVTIETKIMRNEFFAKYAGVKNTNQLMTILRYWRKKGWLVNQESQKDVLTVVTRFNTSRGKKFMRAYKIIIPIRAPSK